MVVRISAIEADWRLTSLYMFWPAMNNAVSLFADASWFKGCTRVYLN